MFRDLYSFSFDICQPESIDSLAETVYRGINNKYNSEGINAAFINDIRREIYLVHECNDSEEKEYSRSHHFELLLSRYLELENVNLYHNSNYPSLQKERLVEERVLKLLQVMLFSTTENSSDANSSSGCRNVNFKTAVATLKFLSKFKKEHGERNRLALNIAVKLLEKIGDSAQNLEETAFVLFVKNSFAVEPCKYLATSDYGTDSDSEFENQYPTNNNRSYLKTRGNETDPIEIIPTSSGDAPGLTIDVTNEDENKNSERRVNKNGVNNSNRKQDKSKEETVLTFEIMDDEDDSDTDYIVYFERKNDAQNSGNEIIICSDSEEECEIKIVKEEEWPPGDEDVCEEVTITDTEKNPELTIETVLQSNGNFEANNNQNFRRINGADGSSQDNPEDSSLNLITSDVNKTVDPAIIFEEISTQLSKKNQNVPNCIFSEHQMTFETSLNPSSAIGGPFLNGIEDNQEYISLKEYQLNNGDLLGDDDGLLDDGYFTEGRRDTEELEYLLSFNSNTSLDPSNILIHEINDRMLFEGNLSEGRKELEDLGLISRSSPAESNSTFAHLEKNVSPKSNKRDTKQESRDCSKRKRKCKQNVCCNEKKTKAAINKRKPVRNKHLRRSTRSRKSRIR